MSAPDMWLLKTASQHLESQAWKLRSQPITLAHLLEPAERRAALQGFDHALLAALVEHCRALKREGVDLVEDVAIDDVLAGAERLRDLVAPYRAALRELEGAGDGKRS